MLPLIRVNQRQGGWRDLCQNELFSNMGDIISLQGVFVCYYRSARMVGKRHYGRQSEWARAAFESMQL